MHRRSDSARFFALNLGICAPRAYGNSRIPREKKPTRQFAELLLDLRLGTNKNIPRVPLPIPPFAFRGNFNNFRKCSRVWAIGLIFPKFSLKVHVSMDKFPAFASKKFASRHREGRVTIAGPITRNSRATTDSTRRSSAYIEQDTFQCPSVRVPRPADASRHPHRRRLRTCR